jgi:hypothetical protein
VRLPAESPPRPYDGTVVYAIASLLRCVLRGGHRWDVAPRSELGSELECVRCGLAADATHGLAG